MAIPRSVRPGFLKRYFRLECQWPYHGLTDGVRCMVTVILGQKSDKKYLVCETVVWPLALKKPVPGDRGMVTAGLGQKPEHRHPSSIKTSPYWWMPAASVRIVAFRIAANTIARTGRGEFSFLTSDADIKKEKKTTKFAPFHSAT